MKEKDRFCADHNTSWRRQDTKRWSVRGAVDVIATDVPERRRDSRTVLSVQASVDLIELSDCILLTWPTKVLVLLRYKSSFQLQ